MPRGLGKHVRRSVRRTAVHLDLYYEEKNCDRKQNLGPPVLGSTSLFYSSYMTIDAGYPVYHGTDPDLNGFTLLNFYSTPVTSENSVFDEEQKRVRENTTSSVTRILRSAVRGVAACCPVANDKAQ